MKRLVALSIVLVGASVVCAAVAATSVDPKKLVLQKEGVPAGFELGYSGTPCRQIALAGRGRSAECSAVVHMLTMWFVSSRARCGGLVRFEAKE